MCCLQIQTQYHTEILDPLQIQTQVEASHAKVTHGAIAFFSYIWFKYGILSLHCCKFGSVVVITLAFQLPHPGSIRAWVVNAWSGRARSIDAVCRNGKGNAQSIFFLLENLALQLGLGQRWQPER